MAEKSDYKKRKKTWRDVGSAKYRHAVKKDLEQQAQEQQQIIVTPPPVTSPEKSTYNVGGKKVTGGRQVRSNQSVPAQPFWETPEFQKRVREITRLKGSGRKTLGKKVQPRPVDVKVREPEQTVPAEGVKIDQNLKAGQRMYYDPKKNEIVGGAKVYTISGGNADRPQSITKEDFLPLYTDDKGNLTLQKTKVAALYEIDAEVMERKKLMTAAAAINYAKNTPASSPIAAKGAGRGKDIAQWKEANKPLVPVGYTLDSEPFYFDERMSISDMQTALAEDTNTSWAKKAGMGVLLWGLDKFYEPLKALEMGSLAVKQFIESPAMQETFVGQAINAQLAAGRLLVHRVFKEFPTKFKYEIEQFVGDLALDMKPERREIILNYINDSRQRMSEVTLETQHLTQMRDRLILYIDDPANDLDKGLVSDVKVIKELLDEAPKWEAKRNELYEQAFQNRIDGNFELAASQLKEAVEADIKANPWSNPYQAYSFAQEPERYEAFLDDLAHLTLQKGSTLDYEQIKRLRQYHENFWVEMSGEMVFDLLNLPVVDKVMDAVVQGSKAALRGGIRGASKVASKTIGKIPISPGQAMNDVFGYFTRQTTNTVANKVSNNINNVLIQMQRAAGSNENFKVVMRDLVIPTIQKADEAPVSELPRIFNEAKQATGGEILQNISVDQFKKLVDAYSITSGKSAIIAAEKSGKPGMRLLTGEEWTKYLDEALDDFPQEVAENIARKDPEWDRMDDVARSGLVQRKLDEIKNTPKFSGGGISKFANDIGRAYVDYHRIKPNSRLLDDSISGKMVKSLIDNAKKVAEIPGDRSLRKAFASEKFISTVEWGLELSGVFRDIWTAAVLSLRPAWIVQNLTDTLFRGMVDGGSIWDDLGTLFFSTQSQLAGEIGIVPTELGQSLSRNGLDFRDSVMSRLLYEGWKPNWGIASYYNFERKRRSKELRVAKDAVMRGMPEGWRKSVARLSNWFTADVGTAISPRTIGGAFQDLNTSIEFSIRLRMFNRSYFKTLRKIEPSFAGKTMEEVPENLRGLANQIWRLSNSNPAKINAYIDSLEGTLKGGRAYWSFNVPPGIDKSVIGISAWDQENFIAPVRMQLDNLIDEILKTGREPQAEDFQTFFKELIGEYRLSVEERMSENMRLAQLRSRIPTDKTMSDIPEPGYVSRVYKGNQVTEDVYGQGTLYTTSEEYVEAMKDARMKQISSGEVRFKNPYIVDDIEKVQDLGRRVYDETLEATKSKKQAKEAADKAIQDNLVERGHDGIVIRKADGTEEIVAFYPGKQFQSDVQMRKAVVQEAVKTLGKEVKKSSDFLESYKSAMRGVAEVEVVEGEVLQAVVDRGAVRIQIGDKFLKDTRNLKPRLVDATIDALNAIDDSYIKAKNLFTNRADYAARFRMFLGQPADLMNADPRQFRFFAQQMRDYPSVRATIEKLRGRKIRFEELDKMYEKYVRTIPQEALWTKDGAMAWKKRADELLDDIQAPPPEVRMAGDELADATIRVGQIGEASDVQVKGLQQLMGKQNIWRARLQEFFRNATPGPRRTTPGFKARQSLWDLYYGLQVENVYKAETRIKSTLADLIDAGQIDEAQTMIDDWNDNFVDNFLREAGIEYEIASDGKTLYSVTINAAGRKLKVVDAFSTNYFIAQFLSADVQALEGAVPTRLRRIIPTEFHENLYGAVYRVFGSTGEEADVFTKFISDQADRWSQQTKRPASEYLHRIGIRGDGFDEAVFKAHYGLDVDEIGRGLPFGLGKTGDEAVLEMNVESARSFLEDFTYGATHSKDAERIQTLLKDYIDPDTGETYFGDFAADFMEWADKGKFGHQGKAKLFHRYREHLADIYRSVMDTNIETKLDPALNDFLGRMTRDVDLIPKREAEVTMMRVVAKELGLPTRSREMLKLINDDVKEVADAAFKESLDVRSRNLAGRLEAWRAGRGTEFPPRVLTDADDYAEQGRFSPVVAEYIGHGVSRPYAGKAWDGDFTERLAIEISELPDSTRVMLEESMMDVLNGEEGIRIVNLEGLDVDDYYDLFKQKDGRFPFTKEDIKRHVEMSDAFVWGEKNKADTPILAFVKPKSAGYDTLAHELFHFFYKELANDPNAGPVITNIQRTAREEALNVIETVVDNPKWIAELKELEETGELVTLLRQRYEGLKAKYGYTHPLFVTGSNDDLVGQMADEILILRDADRIIREKGTEGIEGLMPYYLGNSVELPVLAAYFNFPDSQHFKVSLMDMFGRKHKVAHSYALDEELITYTLNRWSRYQTDYSVYSPIFDKFMGRQAAETFGNLYDVNLDYARDALHRQAQRVARESGRVIPNKPPVGMQEEMKAAWDLWSTVRDFRAFGRDADRTDVMNFRDWIRREMLKHGPDSEGYASLRHLMWETEQFESIVIRTHRGDELLDALTPVIPNGMMDAGHLTWIRNNEYSLKTLSAAERTLKDWERFMVEKARSKDPLLTRLTKGEMEAMRAWGTKATEAKAEMVNVIINGGKVNGRSITGAIDEVNHVMLDYQTRNNFDQMMSSVIPFWMFPSRSWPYWIETLAAHPKLIALYQKVKRASQSARYQAGAVNSRGEALPSLEGYLPIQFPGMDEPVWVNPLAPFSFRYVLDPMNLVDDLRQDMRSSDSDMPPLSYLTKHILESSVVFGFYPAPWITYGMKAVMDIPDYVLPQFPVLPQISLIPRWMVPDQIRMLGKTISTHKDDWYPEASWHDYLVEREMLREALQKIEGMPQEQKMIYLQELESALAQKGDNPVWQEAYKEFTNTSASKSAFAYFTGIFTKDFSDADADLYKLRNEMNMYKAALQNDVQMKLFFDENDQDYAMFDKYINARNTPRGYLYQIYSDIGWITNKAGMLERDPDERAKLLALRIDQRNNNDMYYDALNQAILARDVKLSALKVGAPWEQTAEIYDEFARQVGIAQDQYDPSFEYYGTSKSASRIADDVTGRWYDYIWTTRPRWNPEQYESYKDYEKRVAQWEKDLPELTAVLLRHFRTKDPYITKVMNNLRDTQQLPSGFFMDLQQNTNAEAMDAWRKQYKDDVFDALNNAWKEMYWNPYWDSVEDLSGYERTYAEMGFLEKHPHPPTARELYEWVTQTYGDRFTYEEIQKWVDGNSDVMSFEERMQATQSEAEGVKDDIWDALSWVQPGGVVRDQFQEQIVRNGVERDFLTKWYDGVWNENYNDVEHLKLIRKAVLNAVMTLDLQSPSRSIVGEWAVAQRLNKDFDVIKKTDLPPIFNNEYNYYNELEYKEKKQYKKDYPENYEIFQTYWNMRDAYANANPVWAKYYNPDIYEKIVKGGTVPAQVIPSSSTVKNLTSSAKWPPGMKTTVSPILVENIEGVFRGERLTSYDVTYLEQLARLYPQWKSFIAEVIARGE